MSNLRKAAEAVVAHWKSRDGLRVSYEVQSALIALEAALSEPKPMQEPVACFIGVSGSAFDLPTTKRAYTYAEQPGNVSASRLGVACAATALQSNGDSIDRGLGLLQELQKQGFGVFDLGAEYVALLQQAEPVQVQRDSFLKESAERFARSTLTDEEALFETQEPLGAEFSRVLHENLWDLYERQLIDDNISISAEPEQEPVAWIHGDEYGDVCHWVGGRMPPAGTNLYTALPQRLRLADEEIRAALEAEFIGCGEKRNWNDDLRVSRAIEKMIRGEKE